MGKNNRTLERLGEFGWLHKLLPRLHWPKSIYPQLCIGPGDDAGVVRLTPGKVLVATTDAMVEGIHFERQWFPWKALGEKVLTVNLSDLAAMGAVKPLAALITAAIPEDTPVHIVDKFYQGLDNCAKRWKTGVLGGDTVGSKSGWFVSVTVFGEANPRYLVRRKGARVGDLIVTTGPLGLAAGGLEVLQKGKRGWTWTKPLVSAFCSPQPRFREGEILGRHRWATSLIDSSDGLEASVRLLSENSSLGARIDLDAFPIHPVLERWAAAQKRPAWEYILRGGEDYELVFTVNPGHWPHIQRRFRRAIIVGQMLPSSAGCVAVQGRCQFPLKSYGFTHFKKS